MSFRCFLLIFMLFLLSGRNESSCAEKSYKPHRSHTLDNIRNLVGEDDAVVMVDPKGKILFSKNADKALIPASTLKILTALAAFHCLGPDFRFKTEFYLDSQSNLKIKGYGDPLLISEVLEDIAATIHLKLNTGSNILKDLVLDDSHFEQPLIIPGVTSSLEPYDAPNSALSVNFNTVYFARCKNGAYASAESQTPLLPFALGKIKKSGLKTGRIVFSDKEKESTVYAGHLFKYFLEKEGIKTCGDIRVGKIDKTKDELIFRYVSGYSLEQIISKLLEYSNNFISNQIIVAIGAKLYGPPGTLSGGVRAVTTYARNTLKIEDIRIVEGSGISRKNSISAGSFIKILEAFEAYRSLMRHRGGEFYKTGTLKGISTRAGYIENTKGELFRFVVLINTPGKNTEGIMSELRLIAGNDIHRQLTLH